MISRFHPAGGRWRQLLRLFAMLVLFGATGMASQAEEGVPAPPPGVTKECIDEPVFGGLACIYQTRRDFDTTVVLVHGLNGRALDDWQHQIPALAKRFHVLTFDLPGFGDSQKGVAFYSPLEYARFVHYVIERFAQKRRVLVGHSMGGAIALRYAANYPQGIEKLVLADVAGLLHRMAYSRQLATGWIRSNGTDDGRVLSFADKMANKLLSKAEPVTGPVAEFMARKLLRHELLNVSPAVISAMTLMNENLTDALEKVQLPTLVLWGADDPVAPVRTMQVIRHYMPQASYALVKGAGHIPMVEQPEEFNRLFLAFLNGGLNGHDDLIGREDYVEASDGLREGECTKEANRVFEGRYRKLTINGCSEVVIQNAHIEELDIRSSKLRIVNSQISSPGTAMNVVGSDIMITASTISGEVAIQSSGSRLDIAGCTIRGGRYAVNGGRTSSLVFSTSSVASSQGTRSVHEFIKVSRKRPL